VTELQRGTLKVTKKGQGTMVQVLIDGKPFNLAQGQLSSNVTPTDGLEVEFVRVGGQPRQVRAVGQEFVPARTSAKSSQAVPGQQSRPTQTQSSGRHANLGQKPDFHNPYNFVPAPPRKTEHPELGDHLPVQHASFDPERFSGRIRIRMTAKTPIFVPDTDPDKSCPDSTGHKSFELRTDANGLPSIPSSSIRGMLRSAYEAITNSRFGRFSGSHQNRLAFRMDARESRRLVPAHVEKERIRLLTGTSEVSNDARPNDPMYAAWLPRYRNGQIDNNTIKYASGDLPQHGEQVVCWIEMMQHSNPMFQYWRVREVVRGSDLSQLREQPDPSAARGKSTPYSPLQMKRVQGWICVTNANINRKHDERIFFR